MNPNILLNRPAIRGHELRNGIEAFAHHICSGLKCRQVTVIWSPGVSTAAINSHGRLYLSAVRDDALIKRADVLRYLGFVVHELLHRRYTDFAVCPQHNDPADLRIYHNAIEDAWIERRAIKSGLLGNVESLLHSLLRDMTDKALTDVSDWANPAQYPFALAVTCRAYPGISVPLAGGLAPIFHEASRKIDACGTSADCLSVARWVLDQLQNLPDQQQQQQRPQDGQQQGAQGQQETQDDHQGQQGGTQDGQQGQQGDGQQAGAQGRPGCPGTRQTCYR